jgi:uncharacterized protein
MSADLALDIVRSEIEVEDDFEEVEFDFHGGEPFLQFDLIRAVCEKTWAREWRRPYLFFATTNGVLIHGEIRDWLWVNRHRIWCSLSLDGPKMVHDANRPGSFDKIDIDFFRQAWPSQTMKMTVSPATLPRLAESVIWMHENGYEFSCNLACGISWKEEDRAILDQQASKLVDYYSSHKHVKPCTLLSLPIELVSSSLRQKQVPQWCGIGRTMQAYDIDGSAYPCQSVIPFTDGGVKSNGGLPLGGIDPFGSMPSECNACCLRTLCRTCYAANFGQRGDPTIRDPMDCYATRLLAQSTATLIVRYMASDTLPQFLMERSDLDKVRLCDGALVILDQICNIEGSSNLPID